MSVGPWAPAVLLPTASRDLLLAVLALVIGSSAALLGLGPSPRPRVAWLLCVLDAALITAVVAATGGPRSTLVFLYVLLAMAACLLLSRSRALVIALVAIGLYATLILARTVIPALAFDEPVNSVAALDLLTIAVTAGTIGIVAVVTGSLSERLLQSQRDLRSERQSLGRLQAFSDVIFQSVSTGLVALDHTHRITAFNRAAETITGVPVSSAIGAAWSDVFGPRPSVDEIDAVMSREPEAPVCREIELRRADGAIVPVRITASALETADGALLGCVAACEDLSSRRAMEAETRRADRMATLARMAANIAHEVRNPLASLSGAVEALTRADVAGETRARLTEVVLRESGRLSEIIEHFVQYARPAPLRFEPIDAAAVLDDVLRALPESSVREGVKIVRAFPASLPLEADRERFRQVVWMLCLNALGALQHGGELRVEACAMTGMVYITVTDTGQGIPLRDVPHAFEPFFSAGHDAGGIGLAFVHRIVHEHGGEVMVRSEPGLGTEFTLRFPERHA